MSKVIILAVVKAILKVDILSKYILLEINFHIIFIVNFIMKNPISFTILHWVFIFTCLICTTIQQDLYNLVKHSQVRGGACLDGSPPGLYIHEGKGNNKNKFMMYFDSGGFCGAGTLNETL
jgi:hypothetical protein